MLSQSDHSVYDRPATSPLPLNTADLWSGNRRNASQHEPVLIVEDERVSRRALAALLASNGYPTQAVGSAEEALQLVREEGRSGRILLVDLDLPGMSGLDLIGRLASTDPPLGIVMITAARNEGLAAQLRKYGATYLRKPLDFELLLDVLAEIGEANDRPHNDTPVA